MFRDEQLVNDVLQCLVVLILIVCACVYHSYSKRCTSCHLSSGGRASSGYPWWCPVARLPHTRLSTRASGLRCKGIDK